MEREEKEDAEEVEAERAVGAYFRLLRDYPGFRILWIGEVGQPWMVWGTPCH
jgi:hypothetical protein